MNRSSKPRAALPQAAAAAASPTALRIVLVRDPFNSHDEDVEAIRLGLKEAGYHLVSVVDADTDLPERLAADKPDMLIVESEAAARDLIEHVCVSTRDDPRPIVLFTDNDDATRAHAALAAGITGYIVDGLKPERVKSVLDVARARFQLEQQLRRELAETRGKLADRKIVERAKGLLMQQLNLSEDDAYRKLRQFSMEKGIRIAEAAQRIIDVSSMLG
ncbi:MAG: ANTAR domain-containing response regulator [Janthinobacterium lividum]